MKLYYFWLKLHFSHFLLLLHHHHHHLVNPSQLKSLLTRLKLKVGVNAKRQCSYESSNLKRKFEPFNLISLYSLRKKQIDFIIIIIFKMKSADKKIINYKWIKLKIVISNKYQMYYYLFILNIIKLIKIDFCVS